MKGVQTTGDLKISLGLFDFIPASTGSHGMSWAEKADGNNVQLLTPTPSPTCVCVRSVIQLWLTLCDPMDCSPPGFPVHGIFFTPAPPGKPSPLPYHHTNNWIMSSGYWLFSLVTTLSFIGKKRERERERLASNYLFPFNTLWIFK